MSGIVALGVIQLCILGIVVCHNIVVGRGFFRVFGGLVCFFQAVLSSTSVGSLALLPLFFRLAGLRRYVGGDHERLAIWDSVRSSDLVVEVIRRDDDAGDLEFTIVKGLQGTMNLVTLGHS
jgi:hypothetical protein